MDQTQQQAMQQQAMQNAQQAANAQHNGQDGVQHGVADQHAQGQQGVGNPILYNANHLSRVKIPNFHGKPTEDVLLWAYHFRQVAQA